MPAIRFSVLSTAARRAIGVVAAGACACGAVSASAEDASGQGAGALLDYDFGFLTTPASSAAALDYDFGFLTRAGPTGGSNAEGRSSAAQTGGYALRYDFGFLTRPGGSSSLLQKATADAPSATPVEPAAAFTGARIARSLVVGEVDYGIGDTGVVGDKLFVASNLAAIAGLSCGEVRMADQVSLCAVGVRKFWTEGNRLFVDPIVTAASDTGGVRAAPELARANLGFLNYDLSLVSGPDGATSVFGNLHPALRLKENAFDAEATIYQGLTGSAGKSQAGSRVALTGFAYRREWFEQRLRLIAGRTRSPMHGLGGGDQFDGISLERFNSDDTGSVPTVGAQPISGFASGPGVLQYRVGEKVYKQIPIREGKYQIGSEFLSEVPRGGRLEFVGLDGLPREVAMPSMLSTSIAFYRPGDYSFDVQLGKLNGAAGSRPYASAGGRYGLSRDLSAELALSGSDRTFASSGTLNWRMPGPFGVLRASGAVSGDWNGKRPIASTVEANYNNRLGGFSIDLSHRRNFNGGYDGVGQMPSLLEQSALQETSRAAVGFSLPLPGDDLSVRMLAERSRYADFKDESQALQLDLGRSFGRFGSAFLMGRYGHDQYGQGYSSIMANWTVSLGRRNGASVNYASSDSDGHGRQNRYSATLWGSSASGNGLGSNYQVSIDQDRRIAADGNYRSRTGSFSGSFSRQPGERPFGSLAMRGGLVAAGGGVTATRPVSDSLLVVRAKELAGSSIFVPPDLEGRTRFDGAGRGVLTDLAPYREFNLSFDQSALPLGMEITRTGLSGSVRPYRGYVVHLPVRQLRPVRIYAKIPREAFANGNAIAGQDFAPIELDGSLYFSSWPQAGTPVVLTWQTENGPQSCTLDLPSSAPAQTDAAAFAPIELRDVACTHKEEK